MRRRRFRFLFLCNDSFRIRITHLGIQIAAPRLLAQNCTPTTQKHGKRAGSLQHLSFFRVFSDVSWYNEVWRKRGDASYSLEEPFSVTCTAPDEVPFFFCLFGRWPVCCPARHRQHSKSFNAPWFILQNRSMPHFCKMHEAVYHFQCTGLFTVVSIIQCIQSFTRQCTEPFTPVGRKSIARGRLHPSAKTNARGRLRLFSGFRGRSQ